MHQKKLRFTLITRFNDHDIKELYEKTPF